MHSLEQIDTRLANIESLAAEIKSAVKEINGSVRRHETDIALLKQESKTSVTTSTDHEGRIRKAETSIWKIAIIIAASSGSSVALAKLFL